MTSSKISITLPQVTVSMIIVSAWIIMTIIVATLRSPISVQASTLWTIKWFESVVMFILAQNYLSRKTGKWVVNGFLFTGVILAAYAIFISQFTGIYRVRIFFGNPNTLSTFFNLIILMGFGLIVDGKVRPYLYSSGAVVLVTVALLLTGSRSGILGLIVGVGLTVIFARDRFSRYNLIYLTVGGLFSLITALYFIPTNILNRLTGWIVFQNGKLALADTVAARSFRIRLRLMDKAIDLFVQQPIFGYGWYASPSRIGFLDVHFTTLLAELGLIGLALFGLFYLMIINSWLDINKHNIIGAIGGAWFISVLAQSIGGNFLRTPQVLFILLLLLAAAKAITQDDKTKEHQIQI